MFSLPTILLPLWLLLIPFGLGILLFVLYGFFNIYHLLRFATYSFGSYVITTLFIGGSVILLAISYSFISGLDWTTTFNLTDFLNFKSDFSV